MLDIVIPMTVADSRFILPARPKDCQAEPKAVAWREEYPADCDRCRQDESVLCFEDDAPKWSFARIDGNGLIPCIRKKEVISTHATVGMYYFARRREFVAAAIDMIAREVVSENSKIERYGPRLVCGEFRTDAYKNRRC